MANVLVQAPALAVGHLNRHDAIEANGLGRVHQGGDAGGGRGGKGLGVLQGLLGLGARRCSSGR